MPEPTFREIAEARLGPDAPDADLTRYAAACRQLWNHRLAAWPPAPRWTDAELSDHVWNSGDWYGMAAWLLGPDYRDTPGAPAPREAPPMD